jgi:uncharacterized membrane protein (DUF485 family)
VPAPAPVDPVSQIKGLRFLAGSMVVTGLLIGFGLPLLFASLGIETYMTPWGFDVIWLICLAMMIVDFVLAWMFRRRANALDRQQMGLPP